MLKQPHKPRDNKPGRHCWICGKVGGYGSTTHLKLLGYDVPPRTIAYAHGTCLIRENKKQRSD